MKNIQNNIENKISNILSEIVNSKSINPAEFLDQQDIDYFYQNPDNVYFPVKNLVFEWNMIFNTKITL
jgi:ADP-dependent phosphofructokinase/glucokinase